LPGAIYDQELVFEQKGLGNEGTDAPGWSNWVRTTIKWMKSTTIALGKAWKRRNQ